MGGMEKDLASLAMSADGDIENTSDVNASEGVADLLPTEKSEGEYPDGNMWGEQSGSDADPTDSISDGESADCTEGETGHGDGGNEGKSLNSEDNPEEAYDYAALAKEDLRQLSEEFPELRGATSILALPNALRYGQLRDMGLSAKEAYLASGRLIPKRDNRSHLHSAVPIGAGGGASSMSYSELNQARELFSTLSDADIQKLYKRVTH